MGLLRLGGSHERALTFPLTLKKGAQYFPLPRTQMPHDSYWRSRLLWGDICFLSPLFLEEGSNSGLSIATGWAVESRMPFNPVCIWKHLNHPMLQALFLPNLQR